MDKYKAEFLKTTKFSKEATEPEVLFYEREKVIGTPVKVMRTGKDEPDEGWHIADIYPQKDKEEINQTFVKVRKPDKEAPEMGLQKLVPLQILEETNPELQFLIFERDRDFVLYEDDDQSFKIGLIIDIFLEEESLLVMLSPKGADITAPLDRIKIASIIGKSKDPKQLVKNFQDEAKKRGGTLPDEDLKPSKKRISERKNLVYYLKVTDTEKDQPIGHAVNISNQGFMLIVSKPIESESLFHLQMFLPEEIQGSRYFNFSAMSRWCDQDENPDYHNVGFQFADLTSEGIQLINRLIEKYCF